MYTKCPEYEYFGQGNGSLLFLILVLVLSILIAHTLGPPVSHMTYTSRSFSGRPNHCSHVIYSVTFMELQKGGIWSHFNVLYKVHDKIHKRHLC